LAIVNRGNGSPGEATKTQPAASKSVFVKTFGCQMNVYDSERMTEALAGEGYTATNEAESADLVILNTCHIREKAAEKVYSDLGRLKKVKEARRAAGKSTVIAVAGCVAQAEGAEITARQPAVDLVVGPQSYHRLPELLARIENEGSRALETEFPAEDKFSSLPTRRHDRHVKRAPSAFLTVQEGCDKFCTFCVVPYTRGVEFSRPAGAIEVEARQLVQQGVRELTLLGQNVNAYHGDNVDGAGAISLAALIKRLSTIEGLARIRYTTSHPRDMSDDLIAAHGEIEKLMPYLHLPVQSGSDRILGAMNRKHTAESYTRLLARVRAARPGIAISSDFIVGFPGETEEDFAATLDLVREVQFAQAYSFKYSPRPGTPAATREDQIPEALKLERLARLQDLLDSQQTAFNAAAIGRTLPVLVERRGRTPGQITGRTPYLQLVHADGGDDLIGRIVNIAITSATQVSLGGDVTVVSPA